MEQTPSWLEDHALASAKQRLLVALQGMDTHSPIAAYGLGTQLKMLCDFTCSRQELVEAVKQRREASINDMPIAVGERELV